MNALKNKYLQLILIFAIGILLGWIVFGKSHSTSKSTKAAIDKKSEVWTCSMHPNIRQDKSGKCPICGMDLIPVVQTSKSTASNLIELTTDALQLANIQTSIVKLENPEKEVRLYGKIESDERLTKSLTAHIPGRVEQLFVNFTGDIVSKGQTIALLYSPTLIQAQQELIEAKKLANTLPRALEAAREKLRQWKLTEKQISDVEKTEKIISNFEIKSTVSGVITKKLVNQGDYVSQGNSIYEVSDLSNVWIIFDAYESDLPWIKQNDKIDFTMQSIPGKNFNGTVSFIAPIVDNFSRVAKIRVEMQNTRGVFKPGMFATGIIKAKLDGYRDKLIIPRSAVLWTGKRSIVYVKVPNVDMPTFEMREIDLGPELGNSFVVLNNLKEGEEIVTNGVFSIDAAAQLAGKTSMMNQQKAKKDETIPDYKKKISSSISAQLNQLFSAYIVLKDKLVASDAKASNIEVCNLVKKMESINLSLLPEETQGYWSLKSTAIKGAAKNLNPNSNIDESRKAFVIISENIIKIFKAYGIGKEKAFIQFCPMANQNLGAFWLSKDFSIKNPFYGEMMLNCGETRDSIK